jgi:hypothetical protein
VSIKVNVVAADSRALRVGLAPVHEALLSLHCLLHPWSALSDELLAFLDAG